MHTPRCPSCQSDRIILNCSMEGKASSYSVTFTVDAGARRVPNSSWDKKPIAAPITKCHVCGTCGLVMPIIENPQALWAACTAAPTGWAR